ncbi:FAD:protein FMN transferase [Solirhodobacter olei]|uniref:FAD:protein FMN transferase n=1 Tax=Solirhodobacter olei TaxID=2493082 RepID=UPI0019D46897|nr:FAD:protein FMN transferase [Solirhodobacter olei]
MGMPITIDIPGADIGELMEEVFASFTEVDARFSPYRDDSELAAINEGRIAPATCSPQMAEVFEIANRMRRISGGYFDIRRPDGLLDPSGVVKGWAILQAARLISAAGCRNFYVDAGGDIQTGGVDEAGRAWVIGIRNPFEPTEIVKAIRPQGRGMATSGSYVRGDHIYNPHDAGRRISEIVSLTVVGPDVLEADLFATAAFAMGRGGIHFIEATPGLEGYVIHPDGTALQTSGLKELLVK